MEIKHSRPFEEARRRAYMPVADQLDAVFKFAQAMRDAGFELPAEVHAWIDHCARVKARHPKPPQPEHSA